MKGTTFLQSVEYTLEGIGEKWRQGDKINGALILKNHSDKKLDLSCLKVALLEGIYKKIKIKEKNAWTSLADIKIADSICLMGLEEKSYTFAFQLPQDCPITDKSGSLYLAFYEGENQFPVGHIELVIEAKLAISQILEILENFLRFKVMQIKHTKGMVEVKLIPPSSRELSTIDSLILSLSEVDKELRLSYLFNMRVLDMTSGTMEAQKKVRKIEQKFSAKEYLIYGESLNQEFILESLNKALNEVKPHFL